MVVEAPTLQLCIAQSRWKNLNEYLQMFQYHLKSIAIWLKLGLAIGQLPHAHNNKNVLKIKQWKSGIAFDFWFKLMIKKTNYF